MFECAIENSIILAQSDNQLRDLLVAIVAIGLGFSILYAACNENSRCYQLGSVRILESSFGRTNARIILYCVGGLCLVMGTYLMCQAAAGHRKVFGSLKIKTAASLESPFELLNRR